MAAQRQKNKNNTFSSHKNTIHINRILGNVCALHRERLDAYINVSVVQNQWNEYNSILPVNMSINKYFEDRYLQNYYLILDTVQ